MNDIKLENFETLAAEAVEYYDTSLAVKLLSSLKSEINLAPELQEWKIKLQWIRFSSLPDPEVFDLLQSHLEVALQLPDYDVADQIGRRIVYAELPEAQTAFMQGALDALSKNVELIGGKAIKDLVISYYDFPATSAKRSSLDEINFVNQSNDTKDFSDEQKALLLAILKITDSIRNALQQIQAPATDPNDQNLPDNFDYSTLIPGVIRGEVPDVLSKILSQPLKAMTTPPALHVPDRTPVTAPTSAAPVAQAIAPPAPPKPAIPRTLTDVRRPRTATVNMQDILNRQGQGSGGIVYGDPTNVQVEEMSQRIEAERRQKQNQIDQKLEELKKRKA